MINQLIEVSKAAGTLIKEKFGKNLEIEFKTNELNLVTEADKASEKLIADYIRKKYNAEPGFFTMNLPMLLDMLEECGIDNPVVCSSINKIGFRMCGGIEAYEKAFKERKFRPIAMSVFASGAIRPAEALEYVCSQKQIQSIVFGASTKAHIKQTKEIIDSYS